MSCLTSHREAQKFCIRFQPYLLNPVVHSTAYVPALSHYQTHIRHGPTLRQIRTARPEWFDPTIPAFQTTLYAPAAHHAGYFGITGGLARSFRQDIPLTSSAVVAPALGSALDLGLHPAIRNALPYTPAVIHAPSVVDLGAYSHEEHLLPVAGLGVSSVLSTGHLNPIVPASFYGHSYVGTALYNARRKA